MSDELLPYYQRELAFIRKLGGEFAQAHPKIAGRLRMGADVAEDPHVARLIESFAYLNARTRHKLEDDFPEITEAMLGVLYPHYLAPIPSAAIVRFSLDSSQSELTAGHAIEAASTLETEPIDGQPCRFRTSYPVTIWPVELKAATCKGHPFAAPPTRFAGDAVAAVRLQLETFSPKLTFAQLPLGRLRFFLSGQSQYVHDLYELLMNNALGVVLAASADDKNPIVLGKDSLQPVGFERDEGLLDYSPRSFLGYRLLSEYFAFPEKFLFFDIAGLSTDALARIGNRLEIFILLNRHRPDVEKNVTKETFQLGCTPVVNLFRQRAEPIALTQTQYEYRVVPDARRPLAHEIYTVDRVVATSPDHREVEFHPFYSIKHNQDTRQERAFWYATRRPAGYAGGQADHGTEVFLSLVDLDFQPAAPAEWTLDVETTCLNRDLASRLPFGGGQPYLQLSGGAALARVACLTPPTATLRPALRHGTLWRLISHLSLNHLSLVDGEEGAEALREILKLYDFADSAGTRAVIDGVLSVRSRRVVGRVGGDVAAGFCRGVEATLHFDEEKFTGSGVFLFAAVLERFLGLYSSINSFIKTIATTNKREEALHRWPPRAGDKRLL